MCYVKLKEANQICSPLKVSQWINAESACDRKACIIAFMKARNSLDVLRGKKQKMWICIFLKLLLKIFGNMEKLFMADVPPNGLHEKAMICSICYITKSRLNVEFVKKMPLEMVIG